MYNTQLIPLSMIPLSGDDCIQLIFYLTYLFSVNFQLIFAVKITTTKFAQIFFEKFCFRTFEDSSFGIFGFGVIRIAVQRKKQKRISTEKDNSTGEGYNSGKRDVTD
jgi:hypothetical protein